MSAALLRVLLVDDEAPARHRLRRLLEEAATPIAIAGEAADGVEALALLAEAPVDLLLLDIQMPELSGFDVLDRLPPDRRPLVIFTTAHDAYALRAFEASAVDYLLKPIEAERLHHAIQRAARLAETPVSRDAAQERLADLLDYLDRPPAPTAPPKEGYLRHLSLPGKDRLLIVPVERLLAAEVQDGITRVFTLEDGESGSAGRPKVTRFLVPHTLEALESRLDPQQFFRVHRSALVQVAHIREMIPWFSGRFKLVLTGGHEVIASRSKSREIKHLLDV